MSWHFSSSKGVLLFFIFSSDTSQFGVAHFLEHFLDREPHPFIFSAGGRFNLVRVRPVNTKYYLAHLFWCQQPTGSPGFCDESGLPSGWRAGILPADVACIKLVFQLHVFEDLVHFFISTTPARNFWRVVSFHQLFVIGLRDFPLRFEFYICAICFLTELCPSPAVSTLSKCRLIQSILRRLHAGFSVSWRAYSALSDLLYLQIFVAESATLVPPRWHRSRCKVGCRAGREATPRGLRSLEILPNV